MSENSEITPTPSENSVEAVEEKVNNSSKNNNAKKNNTKNNSATNNSVKNNTKNNSKDNAANNAVTEESGSLNTKINEILPLLKKIEELKVSYKNATNESKADMKAEFDETKTKIITLQTDINNEIGAMSIETNAISFFKNTYPEYAESLEKLNVFKSNAPVEMGANQSNTSEANVSMVKNNNKKNNSASANVSMVKNNTKKNNSANANISMIKNNNAEKVNEANISMIKNNNGKVNEVNVSMVKNNSKKNNAAANVSMAGGKRKTRKNRKNRKN